MPNETYNGFGINYIKWGDTTGTYKENCRYYNLFQPEPDSYYTLSFWGKGNSVCICYFYPSASTTTDTSQGWHGTSNDGYARITLSSEWQKYWVVWKTRSDIDEVKSVLVGRLLKDVGGTTADSECYIAGVKLEKGNTATEWSPNPLDDEYDSELATTVYDSSGYSYNGILNGNLTFNKDCPEGIYSLDARGEDFISYVRCENAPQLEKDFTWNIWVKQNNATSPHTNQMPVSQGRDYLCYGMNIHIVNGIPRIVIGGNSEGNSQFMLSLIDTLDNNWHMITAVIDNEGHVFGYIDGILKRSYVSESIWCEYTEATGNLVIGKMSYGYASSAQYFSFNGQVDDFRIYPVALNATDIKRLYEVKTKVDKVGNIFTGNLIEDEGIEKNNVDTKYNVNTLEFNEYLLPSEYQQVEYLESTGTQYIDTGVIPNNTTGFKLKIAFPEVQVDTFRFGCKQTSGDTGFVLGSNAGNAYMRFGTLISGSNTGSIEKNIPFVAYLNYYNDRYAYINNNTKNTVGDISSITFTYSLIMFGRNYMGSIASSAQKIYECQITQGDKIIRYMIPCYNKDNNEVGMYDLITKTFYTNDGTGTFIKGNDVKNTRIYKDNIITKEVYEI